MPQLHLPASPGCFHILIKISPFLSIFIQNPPKALPKSKLARRQRRSPILVEARLAHVIPNPAPDVELQVDHELHARALAGSGEDFGHGVAAVCVNASLVTDACGGDCSHEADDEVLVTV